MRTDKVCRFGHERRCRISLAAPLTESLSTESDLSLTKRSAHEVGMSKEKRVFRPWPSAKRPG